MYAGKTILEQSKVVVGLGLFGFGLIVGKTHTWMDERISPFFESEQAKIVSPIEPTCIFQNNEKAIDLRFRTGNAAYRLKCDDFGKVNSCNLQSAEIKRN